MGSFRAPHFVAMSNLLAPVQLGALALRNRVVMAPLTRCRTDNPGFVPSALTALYYAQRASAGLIISEGTIVSPQARGYPYTPGIWSAEQVAGWRGVTAAVHGKGGLIVGDILVGVAGEAVAHQDDLFVRLSGDVVGKSVAIDILRGGKLESINVEIGER